MATSIYIFDSDKMFNAIYREHVNELEHKMPLIDLVRKRTEIMGGNKLK